MVRIPEHTELEIDSVISRQNVAKEGWTTYYVDGTNGNDANNGLRWETAFKTIQHAIDVAESWAKIYVKSGTYQESITINLDNIQLLAAKQWVVIDPPDDEVPVTISAHQTLIKNIFVVGDTATNHGAFEITGDLNQLINCKFYNGNVQQGIRISGNQNYFYNLTNASGIGTLVILYGNENIFESCRFIGSNDTDLGIVIESGSNSNRLFDCYLQNMSKSGAQAIKLFAGSAHNMVFHNNFINNTTHIVNYSSDFICFENYFDDHSNVDNGFGIATEPYAFTGGSDPRPVVCRNGWLGLGMGGNTIESMNSTINDAIESIKSTISTGTITYPSGTSEYIVLAILHHQGIQDLYISLDVSELTQPTEVREYEKIDDTHYRQISCKVYPDDFDPGTKAILFSFKQKSRDYKITFRSTVAEGATRYIPYIIRKDGKVQ